MADQDQAQADLETEKPPVADPLDAAISPEGATNPLTSYEDEVQALLRGEPSAELLAELEQSAGEEQQEEETEQEEPESAEQAEEQEEEAEEPGTQPEQKTRDRFRFKNADDQAVAAIAKAKGVSLVEAARIYAGDAPAKPAEAQEQQQEQTPVETAASVEAEIEALYEKKKEAIRAIDVDTQADLEDEIRKLERKARTLAVSEARAKEIADQEAAQSSVEAFNSEYDSNWERALQYYPGLNDPNSAIYKKVAELDAQAQQLGDPLFNSAKKPWTLALKAAEETGTLMAKPSEKSPGPKKAKIGSPVKPASGNASTIPATQQRVAEEIDGIESLTDYEDRIAELKMARR